MQIPPDFVMVQNFKHQIACITMHGEGGQKYRSEFPQNTTFQAKD